MKLLDTAPAPRRYPSRALSAAAAIAAISVLLAAYAITRDRTQPAFDNAAGLRVWTGGDSLSYYVGSALNDDLLRRGAAPVAPEPDTHRSSGLFSTGFLDWEARIREQMVTFDPDLAVFMVGTNDAVSAGFDADAYRPRVAAAMDAFAGRTLIWIGVPSMSDPALAENARAANAVFRSEAARRSWVRYIDAWSITSPSGEYAQSAEIDGVLALLRADDGIHLTPEGGRLIARAVLRNVLGG